MNRISFAVNKLVTSSSNVLSVVLTEIDGLSLHAFEPLADDIPPLICFLPPPRPDALHPDEPRLDDDVVNTYPCPRPWSEIIA